MRAVIIARQAVASYLLPAQRKKEKKTLAQQESRIIGFSYPYPPHPPIHNFEEKQHYCTMSRAQNWWRNQAGCNNNNYPNGRRIK
jgi:hypothetical protein